MTAPDPIRAVLFDLDGVIVSTDEHHYRGWKRLADEEGIPFDRAVNERLRGVSREESLAILLERSARSYSPAERAALAARKNGYYREGLRDLRPSDLLPGVAGLVQELRRRGIRLAVASSSRNTPLILERIGWSDAFDAVADGNDITRSKPDPEVFLLAARRLGIPPAACLVIEDAGAGVEAGRAAGMRVLGVGSAAIHPCATATAPDLAHLTAEDLLRTGHGPPSQGTPVP